MQDKVKWIGRIYVTILLLVSIIPAVFIIQFFIAVPQLRGFFYLELLVPVIGIGVGIYGLIKTKDQKEPN
ncbi:hypothetical protein DCC39_06920 [Pueribacillus theae]|uniref:Uncharacterized protein n=1 Tax=Pueribacillus theae TaxID=2171751 RepID=A0A2U1K4S6_9BACI|nr:hypothetical protein [Pueribacillus theae]PWA12159.1 hypothetical protein DCC39_06920 [Pueribacillus theae]